MATRSYQEEDKADPLAAETEIWRASLVVLLRHACPFLAASKHRGTRFAFRLSAKSTPQFKQHLRAFVEKSKTLVSSAAHRGRFPSRDSIPFTWAAAPLTSTADQISREQCHLLMSRRSPDGQDTKPRTIPGRHLSVTETWIKAGMRVSSQVYLIAPPMSRRGSLHQPMVQPPRSLDTSRARLY